MKKHKTLVERLHNNDQTVLIELMDRHYKRLFYVAFKYLDDETECEEVVSTAMCMVWDQRAQYTRDEHVYAALTTITRNKAVDAWRKIDRERRLHKEFIKQPQAYQTEHLHPILEARVQWAHNIIRDLPARCREVMELLYIEGYSVNEAAAQLHISPSTVRSHISVGIGELKASLQKMSAKQKALLGLIISLSLLLLAKCFFS